MRIPEFSRLNDKIKKWITPSGLAFFLTVTYIISLIPLLWIGWYNYPSADDYSIGVACRQAWVNSHNLFRVIGVGIQRSIEDWKIWMGYFTSNFLMAIPPNTFGERFYVLTVWIMLGMLSFSTMYLLRVIFVRVFQADKYVSHCVSMLMLFVTVQCMVGRVEAFYWYSGAVNYMFVHSMSLFFYGLLISAVYDQGKKRIFDLAAASFLGFFSGGGNQMTALNVCIILLVAAGFLTCRKKWKKYKGLVVPIGMFFVGFLLNVAAPGNWVRSEEVSGMNPVKAVFVSFYSCLDYCINEWSGWPVMVLIIALIPLFWHMTRKTRFQFPCPMIVVFFGYCIISAMMTPPIFALGNMEAERLKAITFAMYILVLTLCIGYVTGWVRKKLEKRNSEESSLYAKGVGFTGNEIWCLLGCILFFAFASVLTVIPEPHYFTFSSAVTDLVNGSARDYGNALKKRMELYQSGEKEVTVDPLPSQPTLLFFTDIEGNPEDWKNQGICRYYRLESLTVRKDNGQS